MSGANGSDGRCMGKRSWIRRGISRRRSSGAEDAWPGEGEDPGPCA
jgi:hypothetical protein